MSVFGQEYSKYYDLFYADKDYSAEAVFVQNIIRRHNPTVRSVLDLGCGSARHAVEFARAGFLITGVDRSDEMIRRARGTIEELSSDIQSNVSLLQGDAADFTSIVKYDAVISLFHVVSYQTTNDALSGIFRSARSALSTGGIFVFDFWYGPAVLTQRPSMRVKRISDQNIYLTRIAEPEQQFDRNVVNVKYTLIAVDKRSASSQEMVEVHSMRYLFVPEIVMLASQYGFELVEVGGWLPDMALDEHSWSGYAAVRAI
jgi:SAM-dependent methyltransferase